VGSHVPAGVNRAVEAGKAGRFIATFGETWSLREEHSGRLVADGYDAMDKWFNWVGGVEGVIDAAAHWADGYRFGEAEGYRRGVEHMREQVTHTMEEK